MAGATPMSSIFHKRAIYEAVFEMIAIEAGSEPRKKPRCATRSRYFVSICEDTTGMPATKNRGQIMGVVPTVDRTLAAGRAPRLTREPMRLTCFPPNRCQLAEASIGRDRWRLSCQRVRQEVERISSCLPGCGRSIGGLKAPKWNGSAMGSIGLASMPWSAIAHLAEAITMVRKV